MRKIYIPWAHATSIYDINPSFFTALRIETILVDLDNTLDVHKNALPSLKALKLKEVLADNGIEVIIISNNNQKRVATYAMALGVRYLSKSNKPFTKRVQKYLDSINLKDEAKIIYIGDQVVNDVGFANKLGVKTILVDPLENEDQVVTRIVRLWDKPLRQSLKNNKLLVDWRYRYGDI